MKYPPRVRGGRRRAGLTLAVALAAGAVFVLPAARLLHWGQMGERMGDVEAAPSVAEELAGVPGRRWPARAAEGPTLVLVHGVHPDGGREPRMGRLATLFAREGFVVHVPHLAELAAFQAKGDVIPRLRGYFDAVERRHGCFGVVGVSVGGGLALRALEDRPVTGVLTIGAHDDLAAVRDHHRATGGTAYARRVMAAVGDVEPAVLAALSPRRGPRGPVWVLHGEGDPLVPASEADALCRRIGCARVVRTPWLGHTEVHGASPLPVLQMIDQALPGMKVPCDRLRQYSGRR